MLNAHLQRSHELDHNILSLQTFQIEIMFVYISSKLCFDFENIEIKHGRKHLANLQAIKFLQRKMNSCSVCWKKVPVLHKGKQMMKMKIVTETLKHSEFCTRIIEDVQRFRSHVFRISCQFKK